MKVLLFCIKGFETMEVAPFFDVMGWARNDFGQDVEVVTCGLAPEVTSTFGLRVLVDVLRKDVRAEDYDALAIPGGFHEFGYYEEAFSEPVLSLIREFDALNKPIASICVGALPVGKSGILKGRKATTYHLLDGYHQKELQEFGVDVVNEPIVRDGNVITSWCPQTGPYVALELLGILVGKENAAPVRKGMGYDDPEGKLL